MDLLRLVLRRIGRADLFSGLYHRCFLVREELLMREILLIVGGVAQPSNAAVLAEKLIQAAVDYESGRCSRRELSEARAAVEAAMSQPASVAQASPASAVLFCDWLRGYFAGLAGRDELTASEANQIRNTLNSLVPSPVSSTSLGSAANE